MNERIRDIVRQSHLDVYGLGKERYKWEGTVDKFAELFIEECCRALNPMLRDMISRGQAVQLIKNHFKDEQMDKEQFMNNVKAGAEIHAGAFDEKEGYQLGDPEKQRAFAQARSRSMTISRIAEEATKAVERRPDSGICVMDEYNMKFAELLVLEAAAVAKQCIEDEWFDVGNAIKEHFGFQQ